MHTLKAQFPSLKPLTWSTSPFHQLWATFLLNVNQHNFLKLDQMTHVILMNQDSSSLVTMQFLANFKFVCLMLIIHWCRIFVLRINYSDEKFKDMILDMSAVPSVSYNSHLFYQPPVERAAALFIAAMAFVSFWDKANLSVPF